MSGRRRCLVIHPGAVGDVLLALPALAHLGDLGFERVLAATPRVAALLGGAGVVESGVDLDRLGLHRLFTDEGDPALLRALAGHEAVVSWLGAGDPTYRGHLAGLGGPPPVVVVARAAPGAASRIHVSRHLLGTLAPLGPLPAALPAVRLVPPPAERARALAWLAARGLVPGEAVALHPGAGSPAKVWPGFAALARRLEASGIPVIVTAGPADAAVVARVVEAGELGEARVARDLGLAGLAALVEAARAFVGNDSGPTHLAALVGCPTLALFGPSDPVVWAPAGRRVRVLAGAGEEPWAGLGLEEAVAALEELARSASGAGVTG